MNRLRACQALRTSVAPSRTALLLALGWMTSAPECEPMEPALVDPTTVCAEDVPREVCNVAALSGTGARADITVTLGITH